MLLVVGGGFSNLKKALAVSQDILLAAGMPVLSVFQVEGEAQVTGEKATVLNIKIAILHQISSR